MSSERGAPPQSPAPDSTEGARPTDSSTGPSPPEAPIWPGWPPVGAVPSTYRPRRWLPVLLFLTTLFTTTTLGAGWFLATRTDVVYVPADQFAGQMSWLGLATIAQVWRDPALLGLGLAFSIPTMLILLSHELGHYLACRKYRIPATWPHFLPVPIGLGTFGAFIRIKAAIRTKRELFDVGVAGPLAGFAMLLPFLVYGIWQSTPVDVEAAIPGTTNMVLYLPGKSLLFGVLQQLAHGPTGPDTVLDLHPFALAGWVGILVTALNLLPFGQLDGGHILYASIGRLQRKLALPMWGVLVIGGFFWPGWFIWSFLVLMMRLRHPPVRDEEVPLDPRRRRIALLALAILLLCFMPVPLDLIWVHG